MNEQERIEAVARVARDIPPMVGQWLVFVPGWRVRFERVQSGGVSIIAGDLPDETDLNDPRR